jgi:hypothetical protein
MQYIGSKFFIEFRITKKMLEIVNKSKYGQLKAIEKLGAAITSSRFNKCFAFLVRKNSPHPNYKPYGMCLVEGCAIFIALIFYATNRVPIRPVGSERTGIASVKEQVSR